MPQWLIEYTEWCNKKGLKPYYYSTLEQYIKEARAE